MYKYFLLCLFGVAIQAADVSVGTALAKSGQRASGYIEVAGGVDPAAKVPVVVINGQQPGPKLALIAGSHGTEYASIVAMTKLAQSIDPAQLSGILIIVPLINSASFLQKVPHLNPIDNKNMNRLYPGKADGTQTERISWEIGKQVVEKCDYLIDFHGGDLDENLRRYTYWSDSGDPKLDSASKGMVLAFGFDHIVIQHPRNSGPRPAGATSAIGRFAEDRGKPSITAEAGHSGTTYAEDVEALIRGSENVMRYLKMLPGAVQPIEKPVWISRYSTVVSEQEGIFYPLVIPEEYVNKGAKIGYVTNYFGERVWDVVSPISGVVLYICSVPTMKKGDSIGYIGELADSPHAQ